MQYFTHIIIEHSTYITIQHLPTQPHKTNKMEHNDTMGKKIDDAKLSNALHQLDDFELRWFFTDDQVTSLLKKYDGNIEVVKQHMKEMMA